ncbi:hypothetical protein Q9251_03315 [Alkalihalobacillus macyae]|uniref:hypothetical protein n=1 Tax=Guptibacillus hwajinpoensis TaxID=208199 RepID=UPI00273CA81B|nr:hypothetical protein [Alkalihalobacillus macyae]MDP4549905.1 hypothetical protein [Alkalihalobacillus macyae]
MEWIGAIRYPIYSQLSNNMIPTHVRATTISLLSILDSLFDLIVFLLLFGFAREGISGILIGALCLAMIGSFLPIQDKSHRKKHGSRAFNH